MTDKKHSYFTIPDTPHQVTKEERENDEDLLLLAALDEHIREQGYCYIEILKGDYKGSIAKFVNDEPAGSEQHIFRYSWGRGNTFNVSPYWWGRIRFKGKPNKPKFTITRSDARIIIPDEGEEVETKLVRVDTKAIKQKALEQTCTDVDGNVLAVGDKVLYMNMRYGCGGRLSHGTVKEFKVYERTKLSVVIENDNDPGQESQCKYPDHQVYKK